MAGDQRPARFTKQAIADGAVVAEQDVARFQFDWQYAMSDRVTLRNKLYYRQLDWISDGTIFAGTFAPQPGADPVVARAFLALDDRQTFAGNQFGDSILF